MSYSNIGKVIFTIEALDQTRQTFNQVSDAIKGIGDAIQGILGTMIDWSRQIMSMFSQVVSSIWNVISSVVSAIAGMADAIGGFGIGGIVSSIMSVIGAMIQMELTAKEVSVQIFGMFGEMVLQGIQVVTGAITDTIDALFKLGGQAWSALGIVAVGIASFGQDLGELVTTFEQSFGEITALIKGFGLIMGQDMTQAIADVKKQIFDFAMSSVFSVTEITDAMSTFIKMGIEPTVEGFQSAVDSIIKMSYLGATGIEDAISYISTVMYGFGLQVKDVVDITDALTGAAIVSVAELSDLGYSLSYTAATANQLGLSMDDALIYVTSMIDVLGSARMGMAGRYFRSLLQDVADPKIHSRLISMSKQLGVSVTFFDEISGKTKDFGEWLGNVKKATEGMSDLTFAKFTKAMGLSIQSTEALNILLHTTPERLKEITDAVNYDSENGLTSDIYNERIKNLGDALKIFQNQLETLWLIFTTAFTPSIRDFLFWLEELVKGSGIQDWLKGLGGILNTKLVPFFKHLQDILQNIATGDLGKKLSEVFGKLVGVGLDTFTLLIDELSKFITSKQFGDLVDALTSFITGFLPALASTFTKTLGFALKLAGNTKGLGERVGEWLGNIMGFAMALTALMMPLQYFITAIFAPLSPILEALIKKLPEISEKITPLIEDFANFFAKVFLSTDAVEFWGKTVKNIFDKIVEPLLTSVKGFLDTLMTGDRLEKLSDAVISFAGAFTVQFVKNIMTLTEMFIKFVNAMNDPNSQLSQVGTTLTVLANFLANVIPKLFGYTLKMLDAILLGCIGKTTKDIWNMAPMLTGAYGHYQPDWLSASQREQAKKTGIVPPDLGLLHQWAEHPLSDEERTAWAKWESAGAEYDAMMTAMNNCTTQFNTNFPTGKVGGGCLGCTGILPTNFQHGGLVLNPTLAMLGEHGPEAVVPLDRAGGFPTTMSANINIYTGPVGSNVDLEQAVRKGLDQAVWEMRTRRRVTFS